MFQKLKDRKYKYRFEKWGEEGRARGSAIPFRAANPPLTQYPHNTIESLILISTIKETVPPSQPTEHL